MSVAEFLQRGPDNVAPHRRQVVALIQHHRLHVAGPQCFQPLPRSPGEQLAELEVAVPGPGDFPLEGCGDPGDFAPPPGGRLTGPGQRFLLDLLEVGPGGARSLGRPAALREITKRGRRIVQLAQGLVGQARDGGGGVGGRQARRRAELGRRA